MNFYYTNLKASLKFWVEFLFNKVSKMSSAFTSITSKNVSRKPAQVVWLTSFTVILGTKDFFTLEDMVIYPPLNSPSSGPRHSFLNHWSCWMLSPSSGIVLALQVDTLFQGHLFHDEESGVKVPILFPQLGTKSEGPLLSTGFINTFIVTALQFKFFVFGLTVSHHLHTGIFHQKHLPRTLLHTNRSFISWETRYKTNSFQCL